MFAVDRGKSPLSVGRVGRDFANMLPESSTANHVRSATQNVSLYPMERSLGEGMAQYLVTEQFRGNRRGHVVDIRPAMPLAEQGREIGCFFDCVHDIVVTASKQALKRSEQRRIEQHFACRKADRHTLDVEWIRAAMNRHTANLEVFPYGKRQQIHLVSDLTQGAAGVRDRDRCTSILIERLRCHKEDASRLRRRYLYVGTCLLRHRSVSCMV
jgi:hypothetical protein